jgi:hypothetical protein
MPVHLVVTRADGKTDTVTAPASVWFDGSERATLRVAKEPAVRTIEIDPEYDFPDVNRENQIWPR